MFFKNLLNSGWLHALFIAVVAYPLGNIVQKFIVSYTESHLLVFTFLFTLSSGIALLLISGPGELANKTLVRFETWVYGLLQILTIIFGLLVMKYVSATEGSALYRTEVVITLLLSAIFLRQKMGAVETIGAILVAIGFSFIVTNTGLEIESTAILVVFVILRSLSQAVQKLITEVHKTNRKAKSFKAQTRITGFVMTSTSFVFLLFLLTISYIKSIYDINFLETLLAKLNLVDLPNINEEIAFALLLILLGNLVVALAGFVKDLNFIKKGEKQDTLANLDDNFMEDERDFKLLKLNLANLLTLYDKNSKKLAEELGVDRIKIDNIMNYDLEDQKIENKFAKKVNDMAIEQIGNRDKLTKAYNRYYLDHKANELIKNNSPFKLYFLDLNKFKPINDEHGHEAGDLVLATTIPRLGEIEEFKDCVFRVGGDEFVLLQISNMENNLEELITNTIELPVEYNGMQLQISTSIGRVHSDDYETLDEMLKDADQLMFEHKKSKGVNR